MTRFVIAEHLEQLAGKVLEIWDKDYLLAEIVPTTNGLRLLTKHAIETSRSDTKKWIALDIDIVRQT